MNDYIQDWCGTCVHDLNTLGQNRSDWKHVTPTGVESMDRKKKKKRK